MPKIIFCTWPGKSLLGKVLTKVRGRLLKEHGHQLVGQTVTKSEWAQAATGLVARWLQEPVLSEANGCAGTNPNSSHQDE